MPAITRLESWDVDRRLQELGLERESLLEVVRASVAACGGCTDNDPPTARGWESWRWGVRRFREVLCPKGWDKDDTGGFSTVVNHEKRIRLAIINTDDGTGLLDRIPQNRSRKGPTSEQAATINQQLLPGIDWPRIVAGKSVIMTREYSTWHLCVYIEGDRVRAELSLLNEFESGYFTDCHERIILLKDGDWETLDFGDNSDGFSPEFDIEVRRK